MQLNPGGWRAIWRAADRHLFAGSRDWICSRASGPVLEVAIGTGLNLAHYPASVQLTGMEWSPAML